MYRASIVLALLVAVASCSDVLVLNTESFDKVVAENSPILVEFYAPWCGHCKTLEPIYEKAATALKHHNIKIAKVDATAEESLGQRFGVRGFPTIKLFKNGAFSQDYSGARTEEAIVDFMIKKSGPAFKEVHSYKEVKEILDSQDYGVVVGYFVDRKSEAFEEFQEAADADQRVKYVVISDAGKAADCMLTEAHLGDGVALVDGSVAVVSKNGHKALFDANEEELSTFISSHAFPKVMELDPELFQDFLKKGSVVVAAFDYSSDHAEDVKKGVIAAGEAHASKVKTFYADSKQWGQAFSRMGASGEKFPTAVAFVVDGESVSQVAFDEDSEFTPKTFNKWIGEVAAGTAVSWKKSEPIPESNDGPVTVVVAKNYDAIVLDSSKDVLVEFYAPWCGHCKSLAPIYEEVGAHFADDKGIVIAKIDATANYIDAKLNVKGFPTLKLFTAGGDVVEFEGARDKDTLIAFINDNRKTSA